MVVLRHFFPGLLFKVPVIGYFEAKTLVSSNSEKLSDDLSPAQHGCYGVASGGGGCTPSPSSSTASGTTSATGVLCSASRQASCGATAAPEVISSPASMITAAPAS